MGARKAQSFVTVAGVTYEPGQEVPAEAVDLIDNPAVWGDGEAESGDEPEKPVKKAAAKRSSSK